MTQIQPAPFLLSRLSARVFETSTDEVNLIPRYSYPLDFIKGLVDTPRWVIGSSTVNASFQQIPNQSSWASVYSVTRNIPQTWQLVNVPALPIALAAPPVTSRVRIEEVECVIADRFQSPIPPIPLSYLVGSNPNASGAYSTFATFCPAQLTVPVPDEVQGLTICMYVAQQVNPTVSPFTYQVRSPHIAASPDSVRDYLALIIDPFYLRGYCGLGSPYTGRSWRLGLPGPIVIGSGQSLQITLAFQNEGLLNPTPVDFIIYARARITELD